MQFLSRQLGRWPVALACVVVLAAAVLLPGLSSFGIWEPQERQLADRVAPRAEVAKKQAEAMPKGPSTPPKDGCYRIPPPDAYARTLSTRAMKLGRDSISDSDGGRRLPFALLGLLTVLATAGIAMRGGGARAGLVTGLVLLSMPLLVLQSRQLTTEIGTPAGAALTLYGLVALGAGRGWLGLVESLVALVSLAAGITIGFVSGGALLGMIVPLGAYAAAYSLGAAGFAAGGRGIYRGTLWLAGTIRPRFAIGREPRSTPLDAGRIATHVKSVVATLATAGLLALLVYQIYSLVEPQPGAVPPQRALLGKSIVANGCWSEALGAIWRPDDDLRYPFDSTFEQIAYGTFPWGIIGPIAMIALIASEDRKRRIIGALTLAWAAGAWVATEVFQRKVGFTLYAGFPALALAIGVWVDGMLAARARGEKNALPAGAMLVGLFVGLAVLDLGKDLMSFTERITSLLVGSDQIGYPKASRLLFLPTKVWVLVLGVLVAAGFAVAMITWRDDPKRRIFRRVSQIAAAVALAATVLVAAFWSFAWQPVLATHLSSKAMFDTYKELREQGDQLVIMGDMGDAPHDYAPDAKPEIVTTRDQIVAAIGRPNRVFAIAPQTELCQLHREIGGKPYFVIDDRNVRSLLLSNKVDGTTDKNPLRTTILHEEPKQIPSRPKARVVFDGRIELLGWSIPNRVDRGDRFELKLFYKVLQPVGGNWRVLMHFDGSLRFNGDHDPIKGRCATATWQPGDYIVDTHTVTAGGGAFRPGTYEIWTGFFTGTNPNWKNMPVSEAPPDMRDSPGQANTDRVKITTIVLD